MNIRQIFSKGIVAVSPRKISITYTTEDYAPQRVLDIHRLIELLRSSDSVSVVFSQGKSISIDFLGSFPVYGVHIYPPIAKHISLDDLNKLVDENRNLEKENEFLEYFSGVDKDDDSEIMTRLADWLKNKKSRHTSINMSSRMTWSKMKDIIGKFKSIGIIKNIDTDDPEDEFNGCVVITISRELYGDRFDMSKRFVELFCEILQLCSEFDFDMSIRDGWINMNFYA